MKFPKLLQLHTIILLWGFTPVLGKLITLDADELVLYRLILSGLSLYAYMRYKGIAFAIPLKDTPVIFLMGLIVGMHWFTFYKAIKVSNVSVAMAGFATITLFASVLQPILLKQKFFWGDILYGIILLIGIVIILQFEQLYIEGIVYGILAAFLGALFGVYNGKLIQKHSATGITLIEFIGAFITLLLFQWLSEGFQLPEIPNKLDFIYLLILSIFCTTLAFTWSIEILKYFTPFTVIMTNNLEPVYGIVFSIILFGESEYMSNGFYWGALIILISVFSYPFFKKHFNPALNK
jgi:drug/metabolite transporter (DMT)-like permease